MRVQLICLLLVCVCSVPAKGQEATYGGRDTVYCEYIDGIYVVTLDPDDYDNAPQHLLDDYECLADLGYAEFFHHWRIFNADETLRTPGRTIPISRGYYHRSADFRLDHEYGHSLFDESPDFLFYPDSGWKDVEEDSGPGLYDPTVDFTTGATLPYDNTVSLPLVFPGDRIQIRRNTGFVTVDAIVTSVEENRLRWSQDQAFNQSEIHSYRVIAADSLADSGGHYSSGIMVDVDGGWLLGPNFVDLENYDSNLKKSTFHRLTRGSTSKYTMWVNGLLNDPIPTFFIWGAEAFAGGTVLRGTPRYGHLERADDPISGCLDQELSWVVVTIIGEGVPASYVDRLRRYRTDLATQIQLASVESPGDCDYDNFDLSEPVDKECPCYVSYSAQDSSLPELAISIHAPATAAPGETLSFEVLVHNQSPVATGSSCKLSAELGEGAWSENFSVPELSPYEIWRQEVAVEFPATSDLFDVDERYRGTVRLQCEVDINDEVFEDTEADNVREVEIVVDAGAAVLAESVEVFAGPVSNKTDEVYYLGYTSLGAEELVVVDYTDPFQPVESERLELPSSDVNGFDAWKYIAANEIVVVCAGGFGEFMIYELPVTSVSEPVSRVVLFDLIAEIEIFGDELYVVTSQGDVLVYDGLSNLVDPDPTTDLTGPTQPMSGYSHIRDVARGDSYIAIIRAEADTSSSIVLLSGEDGVGIDEYDEIATADLSLHYDVKGENESQNLRVAINEAEGVIAASNREEVIAVEISNQGGDIQLMQVGSVVDYGVVSEIDLDGSFILAATAPSGYEWAVYDYESAGLSLVGRASFSQVEKRIRTTLGITSIRPGIGEKRLSIVGDSAGLRSFAPRGVTREFIRGDVNETGTMGTSDYVTFLEYIVFGDPDLARKFDLYDIDDDGYVTIGDFIQFQNWHFTGESPPAAPFPTPGYDTTPAYDPSAEPYYLIR